ncbi:fructosamine kinase family protein [Natronosalvus vescus]|uniref:fructosamine kinase family protein n=1 Tax=Natronosalvus vescus TaxID=2953881 RepID=UPI002091E0CB|nr:fructosamine kinase family protein [Natronosalvus vescus]
MKGELEAALSAALDSTPERVTELEGGMIGSVFRVALEDGRTVVAKTGETPLETEAFMLRYLADEGDLHVPDVYHASDDLLVLEHVAGATAHDDRVARDAAIHLASLHEISEDGFGFPRDTLTGPVRQPNQWTDSWLEFYRDQRLRHVASLAADPRRGSGILPSDTRSRVEAVADDLEALLEGHATEPSLIHGDVWRTNILSRGGWVTAFLDPATYYADPEIELAYVDWTDTFGSAFFDAYERRRGIRDGFWNRRRFVYRLYPLLVHVHLFGGAYLDELEGTLTGLGY